MKLTITRPDDWHLHLRDGAALRSRAARYCAALRPRHRHAQPQAAGDHRRSWRAHTASASWLRCREAPSFEPLMTLYLTDNTPAGRNRARPRPAAWCMA